MEYYGESDLNRLPIKENAPITERDIVEEYIIRQSFLAKNPEELRRKLFHPETKEDRAKLLNSQITDFGFIPGDEPPMTANKKIIYKCLNGWFWVEVNGKPF